MSDHDQWMSRVERAKAIPREEKQKFLDLLCTGKTLGDCGREMGWDLALASEILNENIETTTYLRSEAR